MPAAIANNHEHSENPHTIHRGVRKPFFAIGTPSFAAEGDATLEGAVAELRTVPPDRDEWTNRYMSHGTGRYSAASADEILAQLPQFGVRDADFMLLLRGGDTVFSFCSG